MTKLKYLKDGTFFYCKNGGWSGYVTTENNKKVLYTGADSLKPTELYVNKVVLNDDFELDIEVLRSSTAYDFNAPLVKDYLVSQIRAWFNENGKDSLAVLGISGGKDSTIAAALCVEALGVDRVFGLILPNDVQSDIDDAIEVCTSLGIVYKVVNIKNAVNSILGVVGLDVTYQCEINIPPRVRTTIIRAYCQCLNGRMINTCNYSENYLGYFTIGGDGDGDFAPLHDLTATEVVEIGRLFDNVPKHLVEKTPSDGLCGHSDEDDFGFTYADLDTYLRGSSISPDIVSKIEARHNVNKFKLKEMAKCDLGYLI